MGRLARGTTNWFIDTQVHAGCYVSLLQFQGCLLDCRAAVRIADSGSCMFADFERPRSDYLSCVPLRL